MKTLLIRDLNKIRYTDLKQAGGKAAGLGEITQLNLSIPRGFVVTSAAFTNKMNDVLKKEILRKFDMLGSKRVAVRSSAIAEDSTSASWAGQLESFLNITRDELIVTIERCWASINSNRAKKYAAKHKVRDKTIAVLVQEMVDSDISGVLFTVNPLTENRNQFLIESAYGLGELLVQGEITPESITTTKDGRIINRIKSKQHKMLVFKDSVAQHVSIKPSKHILTDKQIHDLVITGKTIEKHFDRPQDIEWAIKSGKLFVMQSRPVTTLNKISEIEDQVTWATAVSRRHTPLLLSFLISGQQDSQLIKQQTGMSMIFSHIRRNGHDLQYDRDELEVARNVVHREVSKYGLSFFDAYIQHCLKSCEQLMIVAESREKNQTLDTQMQAYFGAAKSHAVHLIVMILVQFELEDFLNRFVSKRIKSVEEKEAIINSLKIAVDQTHEIANLERLLKLGMITQKTVPHYEDWITADPEILKTQIEKKFPVLWRNIKSYKDDFGWMGRMYFSGNPISESEIIIRLQNILRHNCSKRLQKIYADRKLNLAKREQSIIKLGRDALLLADIVARYMYLRTYRLNVFFMAHESNIGLFEKAAKKLNLQSGVEDIIFLSWQEILDGLKKKITSEELRHKILQRKQGFEFVSIDGKTEWSSPDATQTILKGTVACSGTYTGRVRLILNDNAMLEMTSGEILVTTMTTPSLMLAVEKAGAIVTDEGGMLCHAAIVSRELNIPCVIGTQEATKLLNDGNLIEVDAYKGIVKKL